MEREELLEQARAKFSIIKQGDLSFVVMMEDVVVSEFSDEISALDEVGFWASRLAAFAEEREQLQSANCPVCNDKLSGNGLIAWCENGHVFELKSGDIGQAAPATKEATK